MDNLGIEDFNMQDDKKKIISLFAPVTWVSESIASETVVQGC